MSGDPSDLDDCESSEVGFFKTDAGEMCGGRNWPATTGDQGNLTCRNLGPDPRIVDLSGLTSEKKKTSRHSFLETCVPVWLWIETGQRPDVKRLRPTPRVAACVGWIH